MKKVWMLFAAVVAMVFVVSCNEDTDREENEQLTIEVQNLDKSSTGKDGGSSTGDKGGNG